MIAKENTELEEVHIQSPTHKDWEYNYKELTWLHLGVSANEYSCAKENPKKNLKFM